MVKIMLVIVTILFIAQCSTDSIFWIELFEYQLTAISDPYI